MRIRQKIWFDVSLRRALKRYALLRIRPESAIFNGEKTVQVQPKNTAAIMAPLTATHEEISAGQYFNVQH